MPLVAHTPHGVSQPNRIIVFRVSGTIDLALRSPIDQDDFEVPPVTDGDLLDLMVNGDGGPDTVGNAP